MKQRLIRLLTTDLTPLRWTLGWLALLLSFGFYRFEAENTNYEFLNSHASKYAWATMFLIYGILLIYLALYELPLWMNKVLSFIGLFLWTYVFLSFVVYDPTPINSTEMMLIIPMIIEMWLLSEVRK